ncbi:hypothetical protein R1sor_004264 [Riccia sorocarpa]|uniref:DDE-1 domain-containing protein n=1 Tax=Riccia sorocarpa TaxID=122646 RepID=A0ABD3H6S9_9MARC
MGSFASPIAAAFARQRNSASSLALTSSSGNAQPADDSPMEQEATPVHEGLESQAPRSRNAKRALQHVSIKQERQRVVKWMIAYVREIGCEDNICAITIKNFPTLFRQPNMNANLQKASRWWKDREGILADVESEVSFNCVSQRQDHYNIVHRLQTGKLSCSPAKQEQIDRSIAYHLGKVHRAFESGILDENLQENVDETHFVINMDNGRTLGFRGDRDIKYADVVSGGVSMTMVVKVTGGRSAKISSPFMIFQNDNCSYPIRGVPDNIPGVSYRTTRKSFMTNACLLEYYNERRASWADPSGGTRVQWLDNVSSHNMTPEIEEALRNIRTEVRYLPANSTHLTQPCDTFVISKIKDAWTKLWEEHKVHLILHHEWQGDGDPGTSGLLKNPGKSFFLTLAAKAVAEVNQQKTKAIGSPGEEGYVPPMTFARKAMIMCGLSLNTDGRWTESQLSVGLQNIISRYRSNFEGNTEMLTISPESNQIQIVNDSQCL